LNNLPGSRPETVESVLIDATRALGRTMEYHEARLQAELLLAYALETTRAMLLSQLDEPISSETAARYAAMVARRAQYEPLAYILGQQVFCGLDFLVDRRVLIPRHETETVVELALQTAQRAGKVSPIIVDVGTGSGAMALVLAHRLPQAQVLATDISLDALVVAKINAARLHVEPRVNFQQGDLIEPVLGPFDLIVSNLPYIPSGRYDQLPREVRAFEPRLALDGGEDGFVLIRRLLTQLDTRATRGTIVLLEISEEQGKGAVELVSRVLPRVKVTLHQDLEGLDRVLEIRL
jgi:release factor glutamine methyltransferase